MPPKRKKKSAEASSFAERLAELQGSWESAEEGWDQIPPGQYTMRLQSAAVEESASSGNMQIHCEHLIVEGDHAGEVVHDYLQVETPLGPRFIKIWIDVMGFEVPEDLTELEEVVAAISDAAPTYIAKVTEKDGFTNVRVQRLVDEGEEPDEPAAGEEDNDSGEADQGEAEGEDAEAEGNAELEEELSQFCQDWDVEVPEDTEDSELVNMINGLTNYEWDPALLNKEEVALLRSIEEDYGITLLPEEEQEEEEEPEPPKRRKAKGKSKTNVKRRKR